MGVASGNEEYFHRQHNFTKFSTIPISEKHTLTRVVQEQGFAAKFEVYRKIDGLCYAAIEDVKIPPETTIIQHHYDSTNTI